MAKISLHRNRNAKKLGLFAVLFLLPLTLFGLTLHLKDRNNKEPSISTDLPKSLLKNQTALSTNLVILIVSDPTKAATRRAIRETWLSINHNQVQHVFLVGTRGLTNEVLQSVVEEKSSYQDVVILDSVSDSYEGLTTKILAGFQWLMSNHKFNFVLKVDDDTYVRIPALLDALALQPQERLYWGFFKGGANVFRKGKWKEDEWFLCDTYLPYARGGGYILSSDLVQFIAQSAPLLQCYKSEDVSVGLWLSPLKIHRVHDPRFDTEYKSRGCFNSYLITHKQGAREMREKHKQLLQTGQLCPAGEIRLRYSYIYNWTVPPSDCCKNIDPDLP